MGWVGEGEEWLAIESKSFEISVDRCGKRQGIFFSWIRFSNRTLGKLLEGVEEW